MSTDQRPLKVFLCHARADKPKVQELYRYLRRRGIQPWLDGEDLIAGQNWKTEISKAIKASDVIIICLSKNSINKEGYVQAEITFALEKALEIPQERIFIIPARFEDCEVPKSLEGYHWVDLFEQGGFPRLMKALKARATDLERSMVQVPQSDESSLNLTAVLEENLESETAAKTAQEKFEREVTEKAARELAEGEAAKKDEREREGKAEREKLEHEVVKRARSEELERKAAEKIARERADREAAEKAKREEKKRDHKFENTARMEGKFPTGDKPKKLDTTLIAALIGAVVTIVAALIPLFANQLSILPTPTPTATVMLTSTATGTPTPTATNTATSTPTTTTTPTPTFTGVTPFPLSEDWLAGCVSTLWKPYPTDIPVTERGDGCWNEPVYVFEAENGDLDFLAQGRNEESKIYGLFARIPERGTVTVKVRFSELTNVDIWLGVFAEQDVTSQGLLMTIPHGSAKKRVIVQKDPLTGETITGTRLLEQGNGFSISFTFTANSAKSTVNPSVFFTDSVSIPSSQKWLFLGYKSLVGYYRAEGRFLEFELVE